jgi:glycosyltransferase involved in cell wall biosynthesis
VLVSEGPLVTVVTPVYNGEAYLAECIESVLAQTHENLDYVICDNCSTDGSLQIARDYEARDSRIRVLEAPEHLPVVASLNRSMQQISPRSVYTKPVHADDWLFPECLARMVELGERYPTVGLVGSYRLEGDSVGLDGLPVGRLFFPGRETARRSLLGPVYLFGSPTTTMIRSDLVRTRVPFYDDATFHGVPNFSVDVDACYWLLRVSDFAFVHQVLSYTRRHEASWSSELARVGTFYPRKIALLYRHGPFFLTRREYDGQLRRLTTRYVAFLLRRAHWLRDGQYARYHARVLPRTLDHVSRRALAPVTSFPRGDAEPTATALADSGRRSGESASAVRADRER